MKRFNRIRKIFLTLNIFALSLSQAQEVFFIADFKNPSEINFWRELSDTTRSGGKSRAFLVATDGGAFFKGELFLQDNAGFAAMKKSWLWDFSNFKDFMIDASGDGRTYTVTLKDKNAQKRNYTYQAKFVSRDELTVERINLADFTAVKRGRPIVAPEMDLKNITEVGIQINDKLEGDFKLLIDSFWIER
jgi:hypothetical protein